MNDKDAVEQVIRSVERLLDSHRSSKGVELNTDVIKMIRKRTFIKCREVKRHAHLCIIYRGKQCLAVGTNTISQHAEVNAMKHLLARRRRTLPSHMRLRMVTLRFSKTGIMNNSSPCFHCSVFMKKYGKLFHSISFTTSDGTLCTIPTSTFLSSHFHHMSKGHSYQRKHSDL